MNAFLSDVTHGYNFKSLYVKIVSFPILFALSCAKNLFIISKLSAFAIVFIVVTMIACFVTFG